MSLSDRSIEIVCIDFVGSSRREEFRVKFDVNETSFPAAKAVLIQVPYHPAPLLPPQRSTGVTLEVRRIRVPLRLWFCPQDWSQEYFPAVNYGRFKLVPSFENTKIRTFVCCILAVAWTEISLSLLLIRWIILSNSNHRTHRHKNQETCAETTHQTAAKQKIPSRSTLLHKHLKPIKWRQQLTSTERLSVIVSVVTSVCPVSLFYRFVPAQIRNSPGTVLLCREQTAEFLLVRIRPRPTIDGSIRW